jgi:hypothetical protein
MTITLYGKLLIVIKISAKNDLTDNFTCNGERLNAFLLRSGKR